MPKQEHLDNYPYTGEVSRLAAHFVNAPSTTHGTLWNDLWLSGETAWDEGYPGPALIETLEEHKDVLGEPFTVDERTGERKRKRVLVPGCGRGYDVLLLSAYGYDAYGLELSEKALECAREAEEKEKSERKYKARDEGVGKGSVTWVAGDFFKDDFLKDVGGEGKFDLLYDYTFLCALPLDLRPAWSKRFAELVKPDGRIVCLEFPTYKKFSNGGPPWSCPPELHLALLQRPGEEVPYGDDGLQVDKLGPPAKDGLKRLLHFQPKTTFKKGTPEGKVTDWISVWGH